MDGAGGYADITCRFDVVSSLLYTTDPVRPPAENDSVVAIGETGLDYHYDHSRRDLQKEIFHKELEIAETVNLPVIVHSRNAFDEVMEILDGFCGRLKKTIVMFK